MLATPRREQKITPVSVRFEREELDIIERIQQKYPVPSKTDMIRAAVRFWGESAAHGLDANLHPLKKGA